MSRVQPLRRFFTFQPLLGRFLVVCMATLLPGCVLTEDAGTQGETATARDGTRLTLELVDSNTGQIIRSVNPFTTSKLKATLVTPGNISKENVIITFNTDLGKITPDSKTALTNAEGLASVNFVSENKGGAGTVSASVQTKTASLSVNYTFTVVPVGDTGEGDGGTGDLSGSDAPTDTDTPVTDDSAPDTAIIGNVDFVSADPPLMAIKGTGGQGLSETSIVTFRIVDENGKPLAEQLVNFELSSDVGGLRIFPTSRLTDGKGEASTFVYSGTVATSVRVEASTSVIATDGNVYRVSSQSDRLVVGSGLPDLNSFTLGVSVFNVEGADYQGNQTVVTAQLADQFNNIVPDGTAVFFTAEGGTIEPYCFTRLGTCSVSWLSGNPQPSDHRVSILAAAIGNESFADTDANGIYNNADGEPYNDLNGNRQFDEPFTDSNGNGIFDEPFVDDNGNGNYNLGEFFTDYNKNGVHDGNGNNASGETAYVDVNGNGSYDGSGFFSSGDSYTDINGNGIFDSPGFIDVAEVYLDSNENGQYDSGEYFIDENGNGVFDPAGDGKYTGNICESTSNCATEKTTYISKSAVIIASGSTAYIAVVDALNGDVYASNYLKTGVIDEIDIRDSSVSINIFVTDSAGQVMPSGTSITVYEGDDDLPTSRRAAFTVKNTISLNETVFPTILADTVIGSNSLSSLKFKVVTPKREETSLVVKLVK